MAIEVGEEKENPASTAERPSGLQGKNKIASDRVRTCAGKAHMMSLKFKSYFLTTRTHLLPCLRGTRMPYMMFLV